MGIAARIERNRIALLRLVFCWLTFARCVQPRGGKVLPPLLTRWVCGLFAPAEEATAILLSAATFQQFRPSKHAIPFGMFTQLFAPRLHPIPRALTLEIVQSRLINMQRVLLNLEKIARCLAAYAATILFVQYLNSHAYSVRYMNLQQHFFSVYSRRSFVPP